MAPVSDQIFNFIIDGSSPPEEEDFSPLGTPDDVSDYGPVFMRTLTTKSSQFGTLENDDVWGWLISTYTPILNSRGEAVGIIGCDFAAGEVFRELWLQILRQALLPVIIIFIGVGLYFPMIRGINRLTGDLKAERDEIAAMKDNLKVGLFLMNRDYIIQPQYSRALEGVLDDVNLDGRNFIDLLSDSLSEKERESLKKFFKMFQKKSIKRAMLDDLNPLTEFAYRHPSSGKEKTLRCVFAPVEREGGEIFILGSLEDITEEVELRRQLAEADTKRQDEMRSLFEVIHVEPRVFNDFVEDMDYEFDRINETLKDKTLSVQEAMVQVYQSVHAIKSNAVIIGLDSFGAKVHELESQLKILREKEDISQEELLHIMVEIEKLMKEKDNSRTAIDKLQTFKEGTGKDQDRHVLIETLVKTSQRASADLEKKARFEAREIDPLALERGPRRIMKEVLMQLVRNSVYHGIETPRERRSAGKDETGLISLSIKVRDGKIHIRLQDDGQGLDFEKIRQKAEALHLIPDDQEKEDKNALLQVIFAPGFSTAESEGLHAGRGIGLNLVRDRIRDVKGSIKLQSEPGKGTVFNIYIPLEINSMENQAS
jgi:two-component system chemotaxis sensor kinase CheA